MSSLCAYSVQDSHPIDDNLCPIQDGFIVANGAVCSASAPKIANTLSKHIPELESIRLKWERKRKELRQRRLASDQLRVAMQKIWELEMGELENAHARWAERHGGFCP